MRNRRKTLVHLTSAALIALATPTIACGPFFPSDVISRNDEEILAAPAGDFESEMRYLLAGKISDWKSVPANRKEALREGDAITQTHKADLADLRAALEAKKIDEKEIVRLVEALNTARSYALNQSSERKIIDIAETLRGAPQEFISYTLGADAYHGGKTDDARRIWAGILALPEKDRKYRGVWAAYMIGRSYVDKDPDKAAEYFRTARTLAKAGSVDALGLAAASLGWEGRSELGRKNYEKAIALYLEQLAGGGWSAIDLSACASAVLGEKPEVMQRVARDSVSQRVVTASIIASQPYVRDPDSSAAVSWLKAVETANIKDVAGADRLAWASYAWGKMDLANRWLKRLEKETAVSYWVRAKLALRAGDTKTGAEFLAKAANEFPATETWGDAYYGDGETDYTDRPKNRVQGELGVLKLSRGQFVESLDLLLKSGYWLGAAYVAERVLTPEELIAYVDANCPAQEKDPKADAAKTSDSGREVRHLLARRLLRAGRWKEARAYFPKALQPRMDAYITAIRAGHDANKTKAQRGESFWEAAKIARYEGLALLGTELAPDYAVWSGNFEVGPEAKFRFDDKNKNEIANHASDEEKRRIEAQPIPDKRFHYRYIAADHAWAAAQLLPDENALTAQILCEAGSWFIVRDVKTADKFYKALISRCGTTELGKAALAKKWFPEIQKKPE